MTKRTTALTGVFIAGCVGLAATVWWMGPGEFWLRLRGGGDLPGGPVAIARPRPTPSTRRMPTTLEGNRSPSGGRLLIPNPSIITMPTLARELARQAMFITAAERFGVAVRDPATDFGVAASDVPFTCVTDDRVQGFADAVTIFDARGATVRTLSLPIPPRAGHSPDYAAIAASADGWCDHECVETLPSVFGHAPTSGPATAPAAGVAVPADVEAALAQVNAPRAFLAAQRLHGLIAESGTSPARLAALVRAYANLGDATRYLCSAQGDAFFARAMIYAERLVRTNPDLPLSHAARGYAYALLGEPVEARRSFARAAAIASAHTPADAMPAWATDADALARFDDHALEARVASNGPGSALAAYFQMRIVEHSGAPALTIDRARQALAHDPNALRAMNLMCDAGGLTIQNQLTAAAQRAAIASLADLANDPRVPTGLRTDAMAIGDHDGPDAPALAALLKDMDVAPTPSAGGAMLPWSVYSSIARDTLFVTAVRELFVERIILDVDPAPTLRVWWPLLKDHRFAPLLASFDRHDLTGGAPRLPVTSFGQNDLQARLEWLPGDIERLARTKPPTTRPTPKWTYAYGDDDTVYDLAHMLWIYHGPEADGIAILGVVKGGVAQTLELICPDHPSAIAEMILNRWPAMRDRAAQVEHDHPDDPSILFALARAYRSDKRQADAVRLFERAIQLSPDHDAYAELAELYKQQGDDAKWLEVYRRYLAESEDTGLEHARAQEQIAYALMRLKKPDEALPYARDAASSGSGWGMSAYASCLDELGKFDEAEAIARSVEERYPGGFTWSRWCAETGHGDADAAASLSSAGLAGAEASDNADIVNDAAVYLYSCGKFDRAATNAERSFRLKPDVYAAILQAMLALERGKAEEATELADRATSAGDGDNPLSNLPPELRAQMGNVTPSNTARADIYKVAAEEIARCVADPNALPRRDGEIANVLLAAKASTYRENSCFFFGRLCELRGKPDDAKFWYRAAMDSGAWDSSMRPLAAQGLRRLGDPYYK